MEADVGVVMAAWDKFKKLKPDDFVRLKRTPILIDVGGGDPGLGRK